MTIGRLGSANNCKDCDLYYHEKCRNKHQQVCSAKGRAQRELEKAKELVEDAELHVKKAKRRHEEAICACAAAEEKLRKLAKTTEK